MALIKCPKCEKEISDKAQKCIHCNYKLKNKYNSKNGLLLGLILGIILTIIFFIILYIFLTNRKICFRCEKRG